MTRYSHYAKSVLISFSDPRHAHVRFIERLAKGARFAIVATSHPRSGNVSAFVEGERRFLKCFLIAFQFGAFRHSNPKCTTRDRSV